MAPHVKRLAWHYGFESGNLPAASQASGSQASGSHAGLQHSPLTSTGVASASEPTATAIASRAAILPLAPITSKEKAFEKDFQ